ncbi:MAG: hypothetical protein LBG82_00695, partial [Clostridiales Family XIII bacterium]|nr:hypothetical protein [Clostridiales Family XIII bacterium]
MSNRVMKKSDFKVIVGGAADRPSECREFVGAYATNSRLMGVFVVYIHWMLRHPTAFAYDARAIRSISDGGHDDLHQFFYIEATEIGIESYKSVWGESAVNLMEAEQSMIGGLGSAKIMLSEREARLLIREYAKYNEKFGERLPEGLREYSFLLDEPVDDPDALESEMLFAKICLAPRSDYELINYFLMRYYASDAEAVRYLTTESEWGDQVPAVWESPATMCLNKIRIYTDDSGVSSYISESLIEDDAEHRIIVSEISVERGRVGAFKIISDFAISDAETAMKLERPEFITVFELFSDPEKAIAHLDERYPAAMQRDTDAGRLYLRFHDNNDHMKGAVFRLNDDVKGMIYVTDEAQLVLAAYSLPLIHRLEREAQGWPFCRQLLPIAKYEFKEDIFYDFVRADTGDFVHYVNDICDFDPEGR